MTTQHETRMGVAICTPIPFERKPDGAMRRANVTVDWHRARHNLMIPTNIALSELAIDGLAVDEARCKAVDIINELPRKPEFLFFVDYDVLVEHDTLVKLLYRARVFPDYDIFGGIYCSKCPFPEPLIYTENGGGPYWDWAVGDLLFNIKSMHMGCTLIRTTLFDKVEHSADNPLFKTVHEQSQDEGGPMKSRRGTEDIYFCNRVTEEADTKILIDTSILCAHQDISTGKKFGLLAYTAPIQRAQWLAQRSGGKPPHEQLGLKKAIDIGAGTSRREWDGYYTYTLDIRDEDGVDYVQDARRLNLPANEFDLVASSHFLEHMGRWEQNEIWDEMYKILKPGGWMEHVVPNLNWAREHQNNGVYNEHVFNVLYGAQEAHGYDGQLNAHRFGYVPDIAYAQCQRLGLEEITVLTHHDDPNLGYNMIIKAKKPECSKADDADNAAKVLTPRECETAKCDALEAAHGIPVAGKPPATLPTIDEKKLPVQITDGDKAEKIKLK